MHSLRTAILVVMAALALAAAPAAPGAVDYSKNSVTGDYSQAVAAGSDSAAAPSDPGFAWGDAAVGAGVALVLVLLVAGGRELVASAPASRAAGSAGGRKE